jgi:hypothetical protein
MFISTPTDVTTERTIKILVIAVWPQNFQLLSDIYRGRIARIVFRCSGEQADLSP